MMITKNTKKIQFSLVCCAEEVMKQNALGVKCAGLGFISAQEHLRRLKAKPVVENPLGKLTSVC